MTRLPISVAGGVLCIALSAQEPVIQDVTFSVLDRDNKPITDLRPDELQIVAGGHEVQVTSLTRRELVLSIVAVIDMSPSAYIPAESVINAVLKEAVASDVIRMARIGGPKILVSPPLRHTKSLFTDRLRDSMTCPADTSPIWDVVAAAIHAVAADPLPRLVVLITDGRAASAIMSVEDVARYALQTQTMVSVIDEGVRQVLTQWNGEKFVVDTMPTLKWLADATGGMYVPDQALGRPAMPNPYPTVRRAIASHRHVYNATVRVPSGTTGPLNVRVARVRATVRRPPTLNASSEDLSTEPSAAVLSRVQDFGRCK